MKWYLEHGLKITKIYNIIKSIKGKPFEEFMNLISDARRSGDVDNALSFFANTMKLIGNSALVSTGMDKSKDVTVIMVRDNIAKKLRNTFQFIQDMEYEGFIESISYKKK